MKDFQIIIDVKLVQQLIKAQFPQWKDLPITPVEESGWDNRTFHLGNSMMVRLPSSAHYALAIEKEQQWLPKLAPLLPLPIPRPIAIGEPNADYPWHWSVNQWLAGQPATKAHISNMKDFASKLATFLTALESIDTTGGPVAGPHSFYRGGSLSVYDAETRQALALLKDKINITDATELWERALNSNWQRAPVWVHGDIALGNLLVLNGQLSAVIDFGQLAIGDPACDLVIAWNFFDVETRKLFQNQLNFDKDTWIRGMAWSLWKAVIIAADIVDASSIERSTSWKTIDTVTREYELFK